MNFNCPICNYESTVNVTKDNTVRCLNCGRVFSQTNDDDHSTFQVLDANKGQTFSLTGTRTQDSDKKKIGKYEVAYWVAAGGFGEVFKGKDPQVGIDVAIKVPRPDRFEGEESLKEFLQEASAIAKLNHPNIVRYFNADTDDDGQPYLVMEWVDGKPLGQLMKEKSFTIAEACELILQVAEAISYADQQGYIHRDLKPGNIMVDKSGRPRVTDFGLAVHEDVQLDRKGEFGGTLPYMSPEQISGKSEYLDGRTDVWSLCVVFYELLAGVRPFKGRGKQLPAEITERVPRAPSYKNSEIPKELDEIVMGGLEKNLSKRIGSGAELAKKIKQFLGRTGVTTKAITAPHRSKIQWIVGGVMLLMVATSFAIFANPWGDRAKGESDNSESSSNHSTPDEKRGLSTEVMLTKGKWHNLFDYRLHELSFPGPETRSFKEERFDLEELFLSVNRKKAVLKAADIETGNFRVVVNVHQTDWGGGFGIFFGHRPDNLGHRYQLFRVISYKNPQNLTEYRLERLLYFADKKNEFRKDVGCSSEPLPTPGFAKCELQFVVEDHQVKQVIWNDKILNHVLYRPDLVDPIELNTEGGFGVWALDSNVTFSQLRIFLD